MSSDNTQTPQSGKRKKLVKSDTDSEDSDESIVQSHRRKKTSKFVSDGDSSDDDSDVQRPIAHRRKHRPITEDESNYAGSSSSTSKYVQFGEGSESSDWDSDSKPRTRKPPKIVSDTETDSNSNSNSDTDTDKSSDDQAEKCPICLLPFRRQQLGTPSSCEHCFCLECLIEWSKNVNTCPVDRQTFTIIYVRDKLGGQIIRCVPVQVAPREEENLNSLDDLTFCEVCHESDREDRMLLCDWCDRGFHLECLIPPLNEVPIEEWFCPECIQVIDIRDAEATVEIDTDEISDLMEVARGLGVSYGRIRSNATEYSYPRIIPRTRHTERVRATIRRRNRLEDNVHLTRQLSLDPNQPSTSSGLESYGDNSQSRSPSNASNSLGSTDRSCSNNHARKSRRSREYSSSSESDSESVPRKPRRRGNGKDNSDKGSSDKSKPKRKRSGSGKKAGGSSRKRGARGTSRKSGRSKKVSSRAGGGTVLKEVRITECNENGEEEEIVTYVKVASIGTRKRRTKRRKRRTRTRRARTVSSVLASTKKRLANSLGICKPVKGAPVLVPSVRNRTIVGERSALTIARYNAGISTLSLFGDRLNLDYSPPGSDTEDYHATVGSTITIQRHSTISSRRHLRLKNVVAPQQPQAADLLSSIINDQEIWHSKNNNVTLKADGLLVAEKRDTSDDSKKKKSEGKGLTRTEETEPVVENNRVSAIDDAPLEVSSVNPESITQAPMYNNPCGGGNRGNFRGGYRDNTRHSHGGQNYGRDSLGGGGRHSYGGSGSNFGRDFGPPPPFYNPNFEHCGPPMFGGNPPFRNRNPQHFRNERFRFMPPGRPPFNFAEGFSEHHSFPERFTRPRSPQPAVERPQNNMPPNLPEDTPRSDSAEQQQPQDSEGSTSVRQEEDCDIYCDIETKSDGELQEQQNGSMVLLPPPEPPSGLLDFEENSRSDKDSDQELVIDDSHKEDTPKNDKYDPFSVDSDSDSETKKNEEVADEKKEEESVQSAVEAAPEPADTSIRLSAYDDEDEEDSQADCPNFSIYSSQTIDVARHTEQQLSQQIGPLQPPPLPPSIPDDDDVIVGDVQACDLADIPEPSDPYVEALRKERQTLSKIPPKKISHDSRGKITFKIGSKLKINNRLLGLQEEEKESSDEKKKEVEPAKEEETSVDREEERKKISKSKFEEEVQARESKKEDSGEALVPEIPLDSKEKEKGKGKDETEEEEEEEEEEKEWIKTPTRKNDDDDATEKVSSAATGCAEASELSPKKLENELSASECLSEEGSEAFTSLRKTPRIDVEEEDSKEAEKMEEGPDGATKLIDRDDLSSEKDDKEEGRVGDEEEDEDDEDDEEEDEDEDEEEEEEEEERFPIEKEKVNKKSAIEEDADKSTWESDGAYTPCKDELPLKESKSCSEQLPPIESGLEPITPTKDKPDDLDSCRTPVDYNVLGTEAISETDEAMNFEDELTLLSLRKEKEMEDGEIVEEKNAKESEKGEKEKEDEKKRKKKEKKEKNKETEKNKENIASENQVAWKKLSKSTKERSYRDKEKRSKSKEKEKEKEKEKPKKKKEMVKKKEKRKELPRYDVRKIVAERPSRPRKDEYGRDIREKSRQRSRSRSLSSSKRSRSYSKIRSRSRSRTRIQRSWSRDRRSYSKSLSRRRSLSRGRRKSPKRRSTSRRRSSSRKRSLSRRRSRSVSRKRRSLSRRRSRRSFSRSRRSLSRSRQRRSVSRSRRSLSRSRDRRKDKKKYKSRSRSRNRKKSRSKSPRDRKSSKSRERKHSKRKAQSRSRSRSKGRSCSRNWEQVEKMVEQEFTREREREREERESWSAQWTPSWSRSRSKSPTHVQQEPIASREWSPMLDNVSVPPKNLTVILTNKEAMKKKKKDRRKESKKAKEEKKRKGKRNRTPPPSKEVFASGDNILVSVCFNKDNENDEPGVGELAETIPLIPPLKRRRRESLQTDPPKRSKKEKTKDKRSKSPKPKKDKKKKSKAAEIAATKKPVAVIDLDQSPFREQTPSPRDVIVLSDDDDKQIQQITPDQCQPSQASPPREQFVSQGPKTPPEPQIKFSINKQTSNLRPSMLNPLLDEEEEEEMDERAEEELEMRAQEELELRLKIGPNTPPEPPTSPPTSPDAYDPFDPTKSRSPTPDASQEANSGDERRRSPRKHDSVDGNLIEEEKMQSQERQSQEKQQMRDQLEKPKIISMVTIKRASPQQRDDAIENESTKDAAASAASLEVQQNQQTVQSQGNPFAVMNPVLATVAAAVQRSGVFNASNSNSSQRNLLQQSNRISPSNQQKQRSGDRSQAAPVFANSGKATRSCKSGQAKSNGQNGNDAGPEAVDNVDMSSPYSPGSTLSDGIFDPPSPTTFTNSPAAGPGTGGPPAPPLPSQPAKNANSKPAKSTDKKDAFDALFGALPPTKTATKSTRSKKPDKDKKKKSTNPKVGVRMDENQLQILDDLPSSAVEMQVKDKFLKKLNRQERVVEEVKLVLKPHYTKKHVTKEEYKDIMRKAVPKICHNKTGEINPKKIAHLIEAYVRKCRSSKKKTTESSSAKASKPAKILWS